MTHRFPLKEIARQAGLGTATIDRVVNNRPNVSAQTRARVLAAIEELRGQEAQLAARGRRMFFDFVIEAPERFSREVKQAAEQVVPDIGTAVCRSRFVIQERMSTEDTVAVLSRIAKRGSEGVCLKVRDTPEIRAAVERLGLAGIPVVTLVTDISDSRRIAYVGLDNLGAGRIAAFLISKTVGDVTGSVLATRSDDQFLGEEEREIGFIQTLAELCPNLSIIPISGGRGRGPDTARLVTDRTGNLGNLKAVYSMGGGNRSIINALEDARIRPSVFIAHDLDRENRALIDDGHLSFIMHHDLRADLHRVFQAFLAHHKLTRQPSNSKMSDIHVITPFNVPSPR